MKLNLWTDIVDGIVSAYVEVNTFTSSEKVQAGKFGPIYVNLGGAFAAAAAPPDPEVNFSLEPINFVIDPINSTEVNYSRVFKTTAETPNPALAAKVWCETNLVKITDVVAAWKALTDNYIVDLNAVL
jgi:hypothetical protein